jgi:integrase
MRVKITQTAVDKTPLTSSGTVWLHDVELKGFCCAVGMTCKTFYASTEYRGRLMRRKVGRADVLTAAEARNKARSMLALMRDGIDPKKPMGETLADAFEAYLARKQLKPSTVAHYRDSLKRIDDWMRRPVADITRSECDARHRQICKAAPYVGNFTFRILMAVFNDCRKRDVMLTNPCDAVSFRPETRRQTRIGARLPEWWAATEQLPPLRRAAMRVLLFQGYRKMEVCKLRRDDIDFDAETVLLRDRKRGPDIRLPLARQSVALLREACEVAEQVRPGSPFVFPSYGRQKHLTEPNDVSVPNTTHDCRREFLSVAAELGVSLSLAKCAVGHSLGGDTTAGYLVSLEVRNVVQRVADEIERRALEHRPQRTRESAALRDPAPTTTPATP